RSSATRTRVPKHLQLGAEPTARGQQHQARGGGGRERTAVSVSTSEPSGRTTAAVPTMAATVTTRAGTHPAPTQPSPQLRGFQSVHDQRCERPAAAIAEPSTADDTHDQPPHARRSTPP